MSNEMIITGWTEEELKQRIADNEKRGWIVKQQGQNAQVTPTFTRNKHWARMVRNETN